MIGSFRDTWLEEFYRNSIKHKKIPRALEDRIADKIDMIDAATCAIDLQVPFSNKLEKLSGKLKENFSIRVNKQYRLIFKLDELTGRADEIYLDPHTYR